MYVTKESKVQRTDLDLSVQFRSLNQELSPAAHEAKRNDN